MVEGSSLENCRRCEPFVSSNLTASAKHTEQEPHTRGFFSSRHQKSALRRLSDRLVEPERVVEIRCAKEHGRLALRFSGLAALAPSGLR